MLYPADGSVKERIIVLQFTSGVVFCNLGSRVFFYLEEEVLTDLGLVVSCTDCYVFI